MREIVRYALQVSDNAITEVLGRLVARPGELEAGLVVAFVGAPAMIAIVRRSRLAGL